MLPPHWALRLHWQIPVSRAASMCNEQRKLSLHPTWITHFQSRASFTRRIYLPTSSFSACQWEWNENYKNSAVYIIQIVQETIFVPCHSRQYIYDDENLGAKTCWFYWRDVRSIKSAVRISLNMASCRLKCWNSVMIICLVITYREFVTSSHWHDA